MDSYIIAPESVPRLADIGLGQLRYLRTAATSRRLNPPACVNRSAIVRGHGPAAGPVDGGRLTRV